MINHVAFVMDGNRRWARKRLLPVLAGHTKGYQAIEPLIAHAHKKGIKYLTFWAFSTENWHREKKEVDTLLQIFRKLFADNLANRLNKNGVRARILGDMSAFPQDIRDGVDELVTVTKHNTAITVNIGLNYGGRAEIVHAVNHLLKEKKTEVDEKMFSSYLYTDGQPDPDLIIRTGGQQRLSGFLTWQSVYSELYFTKKYWPDFSPKEFDKALEEFEKRKRTFGQ